MSEPFFTEVDGPIPFVGPESAEPLGFRHYDAEQTVAGRRMEDHLRVAVCFWHSFCWPGDDVFGAGTFDRPWLDAADPMEGARRKAEVAFELFEKLGNPFFCFHDRDVAPEGASWKETAANLDAIADELAGHMDRTGTQLLWGTANLFSHPRYAAGAATNPDPEVFACAATQVRHCLEVTHRLGGANYVLWGGREGYETLLNTDLRREDDQYARFLHLVVDHADRIGFDGLILIEPKPAEPTAHQYDHDVAAVHGFLDRHDLLGRVKVNIEVNHATLAGHSFHHEVAYAMAHGIFGSVDANRGDPQLGWDTDQFPNSTEEMTLALVEIMRGGGLRQGGFNFDTKLRRQSTSRTDLLHAHIGGMDTLARALVAAAAIVDDGELDRQRSERYSAWDTEQGRRIESGELTLADLADLTIDQDLQPQPGSGGQERLENLVSRHIHRT